LKEKYLQLYIHIPFCVKKCNYCDFLSGPASEERMERYVDALCREISQGGKEAAGYLVDTVFFGGGTPSILSGRLFMQVMDSIRNNFALMENAEITIEANPGTVTEEKLKNYVSCGVNRISFGLQSAQKEELELLGRIHSFEDFLEGFHMARKVGFQNINVDLMSGLPGQSMATMEDTLTKIMQLHPEHISVYSLILEEGTLLYERVEHGEIFEISEELDREIYEMTGRILAENGYMRYEISNYAKEGYACKHNLGYWNRKNYMGFGIGAASLFEEQRFSNVSDLNSYLADPKECRENVQTLSLQEQMEEFMFLGLRKCEGISKSEFFARFQVKCEDIYGKVLEKHRQEGLLQVQENRIFLTPKGLDVSNYVMADFLEPQIP